MATTAPVVLPTPEPNVVLIDPQTGRATQHFYDWLKRMEIVLRQVRSEIP